MTIDKKIDNLRALRLLSGKTIRETSQQVGLSSKTYRGYEQAPEHFTVKQALALCDFFNIDINDFIKLKGEF